MTAGALDDEEEDPHELDRGVEGLEDPQGDPLDFEDEPQDEPDGFDGEDAFGVEDPHDDPEDLLLPDPHEVLGADAFDEDDPQELDLGVEENDDPPLFDPPPQELPPLRDPPPKLLPLALAAKTSEHMKAATRASPTMSRFILFSSSLSTIPARPGTAYYKAMPCL